MKRTAIWVSLFFIGCGAAPTAQPEENRYQDDPRLERLTIFLRANGSPVSHLALDFLVASDRHGLDWRLLPAIAIVESGAGIAHIKNNIFGWNSARTGFASVREGIYVVASRFSESRLYRDKELDGLLRTYNRNAGYSKRVKRLMLKVSATEPLRARWTKPELAAYSRSLTP